MSVNNFKTMNGEAANSVISINELWSFYNIPGGLFFTINAMGAIKNISPAVTNILGYKEEDIINRHFVQLVHDEDRQLFKQKLTNLNPDKSSTCFAIRLRTSNADYKWMSITGNLGKNNDVHAFGIDCTEKIILQEEVKKFSVITQNISNGLFITDAQRNIVWANKAFSDITGYSSSELIGQNDLMLLTGSLTSGSVKNQILKKINEKAPFVKKIVNYKKNGDTFYVQLESDPLFDDRGNITNWCTHYKDISDQLNLEHSLETEKKKYRSIFDNSPLPKIIYDFETAKILEANRAALQQYGYGLDEFLKLTIDDLTVYDTDSHEKNHVHTILKNKKIVKSSCTHHTKSHEILRIDACYAPIEYNNKKAIFAILRNATDTYNDHQKLLDQTDCLQHIAWKQSHIVRQPLANLKALIVFLKEEPDNITLMQYMESELERLDNTIHEMVKETSIFKNTEFQVGYHRPQTGNES